MARPRGLRLLGHPVHPMVVGFPLAFWVGTSVWDLTSLVSAQPFWPRVAFWTLALGLVAAVPAVVTGLWELAALPAKHPAERVALWHLGVISTAGCLLGASLLLRRTSLATGSPSRLAVGLAVLGVILALAGGWLGGELVFRHGVAVEPRETR